MEKIKKYVYEHKDVMFAILFWQILSMACFIFFTDKELCVSISSKISDYTLVSMVEWVCIVYDLCGLLVCGWFFMFKLIDRKSSMFVTNTKSSQNLVQTEKKTILSWLQLAKQMIQSNKENLKRYILWFIQFKLGCIVAFLIIRLIFNDKTQYVSWIGKVIPLPLMIGIFIFMGACYSIMTISLFVRDNRRYKKQSTKISKPMK